LAARCGAFPLLLLALVLLDRLLLGEHRLVLRRLVPVLCLVRRHVGTVVEERLVDELRGHPGHAGPEQSGQRQRVVEVPAAVGEHLQRRQVVLADVDHTELGEALGHARVALCVLGGIADLATHDAASGIDLFDGQFHAIFEHHPRGGAGARHLYDVGELDVLRLHSASGQRQQRRQSQVKGLAWFHHHLQWWWPKGRGFGVVLSVHRPDMTGPA
jgi:hypothetical protein